MLSAKHFRVHHTLSHHLYPNSVLDLEMSLLEPWLPWLPSEDKNLLQRYATWFISPIVYAILFSSDYLRRILSHGPDLSNDLLPWTVPLLMAAVNPSGVYLWPLIIVSLKSAPTITVCYVYIKSFKQKVLFFQSN